MIYWQLLWSFFQIGLFSIGGGYAAMPLIQHQVVEVHPWLTLTEFTDIVTLSQMTPGPIAINSATFVGMRIAGISGRAGSHRGLCAALLRDCAHPGLGLLPLPQPVGDSGRAGRRSPRRGGDDASAGLSILLLALFGSEVISLPLLDLRALGIFALALAVLRIFKPDPIWVMAGAGVLGGILYSL